MFIHEGVSREKPPAGFFACSCLVDIRFPALEAMIKPSLGYAPEDRMCALVRALIHYVPPEHLHDGNAHLVETDPANGTAARQRFRDDIDQYLEPVRHRFDDVSILADEDFVPRFFHPLGWAIWRAPYVKSTAGAQEWQAYADRLEAQARQVLDEEEGASGDTRIFTGIAALQRGASLQDAQRLLTVLQALRCAG
ncbi:MAG: hypothetical protein EOP92_06395 [Lysobacteraceae bacterium]|nr:MAG: hypothetical protein EOP92_06395 [Xanthomonadaceae bacterium]